MLDRSDVSFVHRRLPFPKDVVVYKLEDDAVIGSIAANYSQVRPHTLSETVEIFGPSVSKSCQIRLFVEEIPDWVVEPYQIIAAYNGWWRVERVSLQMMDTVYVCECLPASELT